MKHCISEESLVCIIGFDVGEVQTKLRAEVLNCIVYYLLSFLFSEAQDLPEEPHLRIWKFIEYRYTGRSRSAITVNAASKEHDCADALQTMIRPKSAI